MENSSLSSRPSSPHDISKLSRSRWMPALIFLFGLVVLGGGTILWTQGIALLGIGLFVIYAPPRRGPGKLADAAMLGLLGIILAGFLPVPASLRDSWWIEAAQDLGIRLPATASFQPWLSAEALAPFLGGVAWLYAAISWKTGHEMRANLLWAFAFSVTVLAIGLIAGTLLHIQYPFATEVQSFSYFPNRNQTSNLLAMGGIVSFGMGIRSLRRGPHYTLAGLACAGIIFFALIYSLSRAGIFLFAIGCLVWVALSVRPTNTARVAILSISGVVLLFSLLVFFGGSMIDRSNRFFTGLRGDAADFRLLIYEDSWDMITDLPLTGAGLSNYSAVFPQYRDASANHNSILHPESDWLWLWAELGLPGILCALALLFALLRGLHFERKYRRRSNSLAAVAALLIFILHSLVDVAGHRLGTFLAAAWLYGIAWHPSSSSTSPSHRPLWLSPRKWRLAGVILAASGITWIAADAFSLPWHSSVILQRSEAMLGSASGAQLQNLEYVRKSVDLAVRRYPLDWRAYFNRAQVKLYRLGEPQDALDDFRRARFLEPIAAQVPYYEGLAWLPFQPVLAVSAWREALARQTDDRALIIRGILANARYSPRVMSLVSDLSLIEPDLRYQFLERFRGDAFLRQFERDLALEPALESFSFRQKENLLNRWLSAEKFGIINDFLIRHPALAEEQWLFQANLLVRQKRFQDALAIVWNKLAAPSIPDFREGDTTNDLRMDFLGSPTNIAVATSLLNRRVAASDWSGVDKILTVLESQDPFPPFVPYWRSKIQFNEGLYEQSWHSLQVFLNTASSP